jgi:F-type H+-transporting ATPase subunit b
MLDLSPILLISSAVVFLIVLVRLNSCLYNPLLKHMEQRDESIKNDLESAQNNASNVDDLYIQANEIISAAKKEASSIRQNTTNDAKTLSATKVNEFKSSLNDKYDLFVSDLNTQTQSLKLSLVNQLPSFKEQLSSKISKI